MLDVMGNSKLVISGSLTKHFILPKVLHCLASQQIHPSDVIG